MSAQVQVEMAGQGISLAGAGVGTGEAIATSGLTLGAGLATLGIGAGLAVLIMSLFHGANPNQVPASQIEQIFEIAADNLYALMKAGIITQAQAIQGMQALISAGQQMESQYQPQIGQPAVKGSENLTNVITAEMQAAESYSPLPSLQTGVTLTEAQQYYAIQTGAKGWYAGSITKASSVTDQLVTSFLSQNNTSNPITQAVAALTGTQTAGTSGLGSLLLLAALGFIIWKVMQSGG